MQSILSVRNLAVEFDTTEGRVAAVRDVSFDVRKGSTLGIVGESGCGKSVSALSVMGLVPDPPGRVVGGVVEYRGEDLLAAGPKRMRRIRGNKISMVFQEPMTSLNPVFTVGRQIEETLGLHQRGLGSKGRREEAAHFLDLVGIPDPEARAREYPHQLSGGMRQRVMIAMALACGPDVLIADEPTTALDVTIQAQILDLMRRLQGEIGMGIVLITHDLGVVAEVCDHVAVMYCGRIVEEARVRDLFARPRHPYTRALIDSIPSSASAGGRLPTIEGSVPSLLSLPRGCSFQNRCPRAEARCREEEPVLGGGGGHAVACFRPVDGGAA